MTVAPAMNLDDARLIKTIRLEILPGHREQYMQSQEIWNQESRRDPGYLGELVGDGDDGAVYVMTFWKSRADYDRWMDTEHDRIAGLAFAEAHYTSIDIRIIEVV